MIQLQYQVSLACLDHLLNLDYKVVFCTVQYLLIAQKHTSCTVQNAVIGPVYAADLF